MPNPIYDKIAAEMIRCGELPENYFDSRIHEIHPGVFLFNRENGNSVFYKKGHSSPDDEIISASIFELHEHCDVCEGECKIKYLPIGSVTRYVDGEMEMEYGFPKFTSMEVADLMEGLNKLYKGHITKQSKLDIEK